jgi:antitoxin component of MazEF toxin-antitoxin module
MTGRTQMNKTIEKPTIAVVGNSWVIELPNDFVNENSLESGTKVLLTFKDEKVNAEILPPLSDKLASIASKLLKKRRKVFEELKNIGD